MKVRWQRNFKSKTHPYWFYAKYPSGRKTFQSFWLNIWW